ncbi:winged helix-turn-helix transcriptional regulator [Alteribacillus sp. JSM 102045]|uniref:winged helix-turn-helix transcriptional regulator n=1 Tax=Alteribacillus sp. JSM 102045 TaxID=1562101 RepID=UPI0035BEDE5C
MLQQLKKLENDGLVARKSYPVVPPRVEYSLTEYGKSIDKLFYLMEEWGKRYLIEHKASPNQKKRNIKNTHNF